MMMRAIVLAALAAVTWAATAADEASETDLRRRNKYRRDATALEARRDALKEKVRAQLEAAETLTVTAELMEGARRFPPVERERASEIKSFETAAPRAVEKKPADKSTCVHRWLSLDEGSRYRFTAEVRAEGVRDTNIKFGLMVPQRGAATDWPAASVGAGSFDWRTVSFDYLMPSGASSALLLYGLESGSGKVEFRNVNVHEITRVLE